MPPSPELPQSLPRLPAEPPPTAFDALRAEGLRLSQALSGGHWSDYNLHDPGVTMLEAACYALTELVYRADFGVADHLADASGQVDWARHGLHPPQDAFPCRPTTVDDLRRWLLDRHPELDGVTVHADPRAPGVLNLQLDTAEGLDAARQEDLKLAVRRSAAQARNLGETVGQVLLLREKRCRLHVTLTVSGGRDPSDILAEVWDRCESYLVAGAEVESVADAQPAGVAPEEWFEGPLTHHGRIPQYRLERAERADLVIAELVRRVRRVEGVQDVAGMALQPLEPLDPVLPPPGGWLRAPALPWRHGAEGWTLALEEPGTAEALMHVGLLWRGQEVRPDIGTVMQRLQELRVARRTRRHGTVVPPPPLPAARHRPAPPHYPLQSHLPAAYGVGEREIHDTLEPSERTAALQLRGYLALLDQVVAHAGAQVSHLRELFRNDAGSAPSYRWQVLDGQGVPGLEALLAPGATAQEIERAHCRALDDAAERRSRMLDVLLSLHGQDYTQNALRQFSDHLAPRERAHWLLHNKEAFAREVVALSRDRAAGFDDARHVLDGEDNVSMLQRRLSLLLGFGHGHDRLLARRRWYMPGRDRMVDARVRHVRQPEAWSPLELDLESDGSAPAARAGDPVDRLPPGLGGPDGSAVALSPALMRCAARHDHYGVEPRSHGRVRLLLGPYAPDSYWVLAGFSAEEAARPGLLRRMAREVRRWALRQNDAAEGLHVVEHVLLRPVGRDAPAHQGLPEHFLDLQLSVVFPNWTLRCCDRRFRALAEETLRINLPAHLEAHCLWLDPGSMQSFESAYETWLEKRRLWMENPEDPQRCRTLNGWSGALARWLAQRLERQYADRERGVGSDEADEGLDSADGQAAD